MSRVVCGGVGGVVGRGQIQFLAGWRRWGVAERSEGVEGWRRGGRAMWRGQVRGEWGEEGWKATQTPSSHPRPPPFPFPFNSTDLNYFFLL